MAEISSVFRIPNAPTPKEAYNFVDPADYEVYSELNKIAEEIEECRLNAR